MKYTATFLGSIFGRPKKQSTAGERRYGLLQNNWKFFSNRMLLASPNDLKKRLGIFAQLLTAKYKKFENHETRIWGANGYSTSQSH